MYSKKNLKKQKKCGEEAQIETTRLIRFWASSAEINNSNIVATVRKEPEIVYIYTARNNVLNLMIPYNISPLALKMLHNTKNIKTLFHFYKK